MQPAGAADEKPKTPPAGGGKEGASSKIKNDPNAAHETLDIAKNVP